LNRTFECLCQFGWTNIHCETEINYCENVQCLNGGVCRSLFLNYSCECLGTSYSGRDCQIVERSTVIRQAVSKSFGYIAIVSITSAFMFVFIMDVLKYCFGIDPIKDELEKKRRKKQAKKVKRRPLIQRSVNVNAPVQPVPRTTTKEGISTIEETNV